MHKGVYQLALASLVTAVDLAVFIHCIPIICAAWGASRSFMAALSILVFIWVESLTNLWKAAYRATLAKVCAPASVFELPQFPIAGRGGDSDV